MKPNFALKLSHDSVEILQRAASGWIVTGSTRFDISDLDDKLRQLRLAAEALAPEGLRAKLVMPDSEVRYATVIAPGPTDEARRLQIEAEIEGLTPYALHELIYDYVVEGDHALVAICARDILTEAEDFAQTHGFNPVSFAAIPPAGAFAGEPFFGETAGARAFLSRDASVEREREPVRVAGQRKPAEPAKPAPPARPAAPPPAPSASARPAAASGSTVAGATAAAAGSVAAATPDAFSRVGNLVRRMGTRIRREQAQAGAEGKTTKAPQAAAGKSPPTAVPPSATREKPTAWTQPASRPDASKAGAPLAAGIKAAKPDAAAVNPPTQPAAPTKPSKPVEPQGGKPAPVAFSSRRSAAAPQAAGPAPASGPTLASEGTGAQAGKPGPGGRIAVLPGSSEKERPGRMTRLYRRGRRAARGALATIGLAKPAEGGGNRRGGRKRNAEAHAKPLVAASSPTADEREKAKEAEALTIFGARNMQRTETGFARRGLMLTGGLLLLLVAVAIWAVYFASGPVREGDIALTPRDETAALPQIDAPARVSEPQAAPAEITVPAPATPPAEDDTVTAAEIAAQEPETVAPTPSEAAPEETVTGQTTDPDALLEELVQEALTDAMPIDLLGQADESAVSPGDTGAPVDAGETALAGVETGQVPGDRESIPDQRLALPSLLERPQLAEVAPLSPPPPPPFGTEFALGPDGLVEATPEGAMTPSGVMVYAGAPSEVPPVRPAGIAPQPPAPAEAAPEPEPDAAPEPEVTPEPEAQIQTPEETEEAAVIADDTPRADPALAGVRPQPRSPLAAERAAQARAAEEGAAPEPTPDPAPEDAPDATPGAPDPEDDSAAATPPPGGVLLDSLRPQRRPTDLVPPAETAAVEEVAEQAPEVVAVSLRPTARPSDISARVQESLAAARNAPATTAAATTAAAAPAAAPAASAAPNIPTSASVAQQATQARAINLRRVNLIGVFGTPNDRRALVRLSNGQVVRVRVGDRLDGGQVSAIGDDELRYVKNGRNEVLRIGSSG